MRIMGRKIPAATIGIYLTVIVVTIVILLAIRMDAVGLAEAQP